MSIRKTSQRVQVCLRRMALILVIPLGMSSCETVAPALLKLGLSFGQDLLAAASVNYAPRYASQLETLLTVLASEVTGMKFEARLARQGYQPPPPEYLRYQNRYPNTGYTTQPASGPSSQNPYGQPTQNPYGQQQPQYPDSQPAQNPYGQPQDPYATQNPYGQPTQDPYEAQSQDPYGQQQNPYGTANSQRSDNPYATRGLVPIAMNVAILAQRAGEVDLQPIEDGEVLYDGKGDPARGDKIKVHFSTNCDCYVYVVGVDATGYVARMYPDPDAEHKDQVDAGRVYVLPEGDEWWGLDNYPGVEQIYFVASYTRREDIEAAIEQMAAQPRKVTHGEYRAVAEPAVIPSVRGLVKVKARDSIVVLAANGIAQEVTPTSFFSETAGGELVITRWFKHQ